MRGTCKCLRTQPACMVQLLSRAACASRQKMLLVRDAKRAAPTPVPRKHPTTGSAIKPGNTLMPSDARPHWLFLPPWVHPSSAEGPMHDLHNTQTNAGVLACLQPSDFIISTYPGSAVSPPSAAADSSPATRASSRARGRNGADSNAETADLYCPNTLVHFRRNVDFKRIASSSVWASLLEPADVPLARAQLVELMKMERNLLTFYKKHCQRYMAGVCLRLQQATARAEAGEEVCVLAALKREVHALQMGLYINIPDDPTALPKFLVPYSKVTAGEAAAESGSDSDGLEVVEVDDAPPPHKAHAPATAVLLE